ncbi:MAG: NHLP leader peptide family RiPP precursor [Bryobacteraceae bacterium]
MSNLQQARQDLETNLIAKAVAEPDFRAALLSDPKKAIREAAGIQFADAVRVSVHEETPTDLHLVLPVEFQTGGELSDEHLEAVAGGYGGPIQTGPHYTTIIPGVVYPPGVVPGQGSGGPESFGAPSGHYASSSK